MKTCSRCKAHLPLDRFGVRRNAKDGLNSRCKPCNVASVRESQQRHPETRRAWEEAHREHRNQVKRESPARLTWEEANRERRNTQKREWARRRRASS